MERVALLVDGFNFYHSLDNHRVCHHYKWLDVKKLSRALILPSKQAISDIIYFTSFPEWNLPKVKRHKMLMAIYEGMGVEVVTGVFKKVPRTCEGDCRKTYQKYEEKQTDVNIAIRMMDLGYRNKCDRIMLLTADSDQVPTVKLFRERFPEKFVTVVLPFGEKGVELSSEANDQKQITLVQLKSSRLDDPYICPKGNRYFAPDNWKRGELIQG